MSTASLPRPGSAAAWWLAVRPATLAASTVPVLLGSAVAYHHGAWRPGLVPVAWLTASLLQVAANLANDVFDAERGADTAERLGPTRVTQAGLLAPRTVKRALAGVVLAALLSGSVLVAAAGWPLLVLGALSVLAALAYTAGPYPLAYHGLGDLFVVLFFGGVGVMGTLYLHSGSVTGTGVVAALPVGSLANLLLIVNNLRDRQGDARAGKRTLVVLLGERVARRHIDACLFIAYGATLWLAIEVGPGALLPLATLPGAWRLRGEVRALDGAALNGPLVRSARLLLAFGLLLAAGIFLAARGPS